MLPITPQMKILVAVEPADFRRGIDGLARRCQERRQHDPLVGAVFVFRHRNGTALKLLTSEGQGFWLCHKRLSQGRLPWRPSAAEGVAQRWAAHQLAVFLAAGNPTRTGAAAAWRPVGPRTGPALPSALAGRRLLCSPNLQGDTPRRLPGRSRSPPARSLGCRRMRTAPEMMEVDSTQREEVLRRVEQALDAQDAPLIRAVSPS